MERKVKWMFRKDWNESPFLALFFTEAAKLNRLLRYRYFDWNVCLIKCNDYAVSLALDPRTISVYYTTFCELFNLLVRHLN